MEWIRINNKSKLPYGRVLAINQKNSFAIGALKKSLNGTIVCERELKCGIMEHITHYAILSPPAKILNITGPRDIFFKRVIDCVCKFYDILESNLFSTRRKTEDVMRRAICYKILRDAGLSTVSIGEKFNRDHSTVIHGLMIFHDTYDTNRSFKIDYHAIIDILENKSILTQIKP